MIELVNNEGQRGGNQDSDIDGKRRGMKVFAVGKDMKENKARISVFAEKKLRKQKEKEREEEREHKTKLLNNVIVFLYVERIIKLRVVYNYMTQNGT